MATKEKSILVVFGEGGHYAQANRLMKLLGSIILNTNVVSLSDVKKKPCWSDCHYTTGEMRGKYSLLAFFTNAGPFQIILDTKRLRKNHDIAYVLSTGPGISIFTSLYFKAYGAKIIHIETWSRFKTKSLTGRFMYYIAEHFYVQNLSLLDIYPKAKYSGLL